MTRIPAAALALLVTACAGDPEHAWHPTEPSFGRDQAVAQHAFCGVLFDGLAAAADDDEDRAVLQRMSDAAALRLAQLGAGPADPNVRDGERHAAVYALGAAAGQIIAAGELCVDVVMMGETR